VNFTSILMSV